MGGHQDQSGHPAWRSQRISTAQKDKPIEFKGPSPGVRKNWHLCVKLLEGWPGDVEELLLLLDWHGGLIA